MSGCIVDRRQDARDAADEIEAHPRVVSSVAVLSPAEDPLDRWTLDVAVETGDRVVVPDGLLQLLRDEGFGVYRLVPRGPDHHNLVAVACH